MSISNITLPQAFLLAAAGIAAGSVILAAIGLVAAWTLGRRSLPLGHGLLVASLVVVALLPVLIPWLQSRGVGWDIRSERPNSPRTFAPATTTFQQGPDSSTTLELPTDGSLQADGMTVAEVMARYGESTSPAVRTSTPAAPQHEEAIDVRRLTVAGANILCLAWVAGSCFSLIRALRASRSLGRWMRRAALVSEPHIVELLNACASDAGLARTPTLVSSSEATVPYVSGLWRPRIVLPASLAAADEPTLRGILLHELAHIRRRDLWVGLLQRLVGAAYWWNPLVHRLNARLAEVREDLCDNYVLAHISDPRDYAQTLVDLASQAAAVRVVPSMGLLNRSPNRLSGRIQRILQEDRPMATRLGGVSKVLLMVFVFALGAGSTLFVIRLPDILPDHGETAPAFLDAPEVLVDSQPEPMISLVRNDAVASNPAPESANWDVVVFPPIATTEEAAASKAEAVVEAPDLFVPTENSLPPTVPDVAPPEAFANEPVPQDPGLAPGEFSAPPTLAGSPLELPTTEPEAVPQRDPDAAPSLFEPAAAEPQVAGDDPFSSASGLIQPEATSASTPSPPAPSSAPAIEIVLLQLTANEDGSLKQLRYFTEDLGNDDDAFQQLADRIAAWGKEWDENGPPHETELHIEADASLRFESVTRVVSLCTPHVTRILLAKAAEGPIVTVTVGFVRDTKGKQVSGTPVLIFEDQTVDWDSLEARFDEWAKMQRTRDPAWQRRYTVVIRADEGVEAKVVESIIKKAHEYGNGFENFTLKTIDVPEGVAPAVSGIVNQIDPETRLVQISIGDDDGLRPGRRLSVFRADDGDPIRHGGVIGRLEVIRVQADSAACRIIEEHAEMRIGVGDNVVTTESEEVSPALEPDQSRF